MTPDHRGTFDPLADGYDDVAISDLGRHYRNRVHDIVLRHIPQPARVLDIGCGTGIDAAWLAEVGHEVLAIDASAEMVAYASKRLESFETATAKEQDMHHLDRSDISGPFDLVLANFGVVNCCQDLARFGRWLESALAETGAAVLVTMAPICPPELVHGALTMNRELLGRRRSSNETMYAGIPVRYLSATGLTAELGSGLQLLDARSFGVVLPTFEQRHIVEARPKLLALLARLDKAFGSPAVGLKTGDHHVAIVSRRRRT